jgi:TM2 domain-containing membrane protein YozV
MNLFHITVLFLFWTGLFWYVSFLPSYVVPYGGVGSLWWTDYPSKEYYKIYKTPVGQIHARVIENTMFMYNVSS